MTQDFGTVEVEWLGHASIKLKDSDGFTVYIDPWSDVMVGYRGWEKADIIISTHNHFDHFDKKIIRELKKRDTVLVCTEQSKDEVPEDLSYKVIKPGRNIKVKGRRIKCVPAYNTEDYRDTEEIFHEKGLCTGVIFEMDGVKFYHASDTDPIPEMDSIADESIDVAFLPVGGHYTMNQDEAIEAVEKIKAASVVPIHYGFIDETIADPERFKQEVEDETGSKAVVMEKFLDE